MSDVQAILDAVANLEVKQGESLASLTGLSADLQNEIAQTKAARSFTRSTFIDPEQGDDDNDGLHIDRPVKTWERLSEMFNVSGRLAISLLAPTVADYYRPFDVAPQQITVQSLARGGGAATHSLTYKDAVNAAGHVGGFRTHGDHNILFLRVDNVMDHSVSEHPIRSLQGRSTVAFGQSSLARTGTSQRSFIVAQSYQVRRVSSVFDPSASGFIINGVPAGANPNDFPIVFHTNFTQA